MLKLEQVRSGYGAIEVLTAVGDFETVKNAVDMLNDVGIDRINIDLMYGLPQQSQTQAAHDIETAIGFGTTRGNNVQFGGFSMRAQLDEESLKKIADNSRGMDLCPFFPISDLDKLFGIVPCSSGIGHQNSLIKPEERN